MINVFLFWTLQMQFRDVLPIRFTNVFYLTNSIFLNLKRKIIWNKKCVFDIRLISTVLYYHLLIAL